MKDTDQEENADPRKDCICRRECLKENIRVGILYEKRLDIYETNTLAKCSGKRIQYVHGGGDPFCQCIVTTLGLAERGNLFSKDGEDCLGRIAGLKGGKERMRG